MSKITGTGKIHGVLTTVTCEFVDGEIIINFDDIKIACYENSFRNELKQHYSIGGTYYPKENSMLNVLNVLENHFFDYPIKAEIEGYIDPIPFEEGIIY